MQKTIDETERRREKQIAYNTTHGIIPKTIQKTKDQIIAQGSVLDVKGYDPSNPYALQNEQVLIAAEDEQEYKTIPQFEKAIAKAKKEMEKAAKNLDFMEAARLRDRMFTLKSELEKMNAL
jgi:excinuclease ABC subunit B